MSCRSLATLIIKVRQLISLPVQNILDRSLHALFIPESYPAALSRPRTEVELPKSGLAQFSGCVRLECGEYLFRISICCHNRMNVICPHIECQQAPATNRAGLTNALLNNAPLQSSQDKWLCFQLSLVVSVPSRVRCKERSAVNIVKTINRTARIAV